MTLLSGCAAVALIGCENTAPASRPVPRPDDYVVAEGWDSVSLATVDTYRLRAQKVPPCASLPEVPPNWVTHALPGLPGATLRVPPELAESVDTMPDSSISSEFIYKNTSVLVMFSPRGDDSPGTIPTGCATRIAGFETPLYKHRPRQIDGRDSAFDVHVNFALPDTGGVFIQFSTGTRERRDSLLAILRSVSLSRP
jgi:hypothetical protein